MIPHAAEVLELSQSHRGAEWYLVGMEVKVHCVTSEQPAGVPAPDSESPCLVCLIPNSAQRSGHQSGRTVPSALAYSRQLRGFLPGCPCASGLQKQGCSFPHC